MKNNTCPYEDSVSDAIRTGQWFEELAIHVTQCENCAEIKQISCWMSKVADNLCDASLAPNPDIIWLKAQWDTQARLEKRVLRMMILTQVIMISVLSAALSLLILRFWPAVNSMIERFLAWMSNALANPAISSLKQPVSFLSSPVFILLCMAIGCLALMPRLRKPFG
jgi:hypothetical protein